jgi:hypothetical protein
MLSGTALNIQLVAQNRSNSIPQQNQIGDALWVNFWKQSASSKNESSPMKPMTPRPPFQHLLEWLQETLGIVQL